EVLKLVAFAELAAERETAFAYLTQKLLHLVDRPRHPVGEVDAKHPDENDHRGEPADERVEHRLLLSDHALLLLLDPFIAVGRASAEGRRELRIVGVDRIVSDVHLDDVADLLALVDDHLALGHDVTARSVKERAQDGADEEGDADEIARVLEL